MAYQVLSFPEKTIIGHRFLAPASPQDLIDAWLGAKQDLSYFRHPCAYLCDFSPLQEHSASWVDEVSNGFLQWARQLQTSGPCYLVWVGGMPILQEVRVWLLEQGLEVPCFKDLESALSYIDLKISSENIRQSMKHSETYTLDTDTRLELNAILQAVKRAEGDTTDSLGERASQDDPNDTDRVQVDETQRIPLGGMFRLESPDMDKAVLVFPEKGGVLGRRDSKGQKPDVDLSLWSGFQSGVSRRHAEVRLHSDGHLYLYDLDSTNGTFLNGNRLEAGRAYRIQNGDEVRLGSLVMHIRFHEGR
jgi:hypothetical protein